METSNILDFESRAVYKALKHISKDFSLQHAGFNYWRTEYSSDQLDVVELSFGQQAHLDLSSKERSSFMVALHAAMTQSIDVLPEVPGALLSSANFAGDVAPSEEAKSFVAPNPAHSIMITNFIK